MTKTLKTKQSIAKFYDCNNGLNDAKGLRFKLLEAVEVANMHLLKGPFVVKVPRGLKSGVTGIVVVEESHIAIHAWDKYKFAWLTVATCGHKSRVRKVVRLFKEYFQPKKTTIEFFKATTIKM